MKTDFEAEIWEAVLKDAIIEHSLKELENYPPADIQKTVLPSHYVATMRKFMQRYQFRTRTNALIKSVKKVASIVLIIIGIGFSVLLQFDEVRAACRNVITTIYKRYVEFIYTPSDDSAISPPNLGFIPDKFYVKEQYISDNTLILTLVNSDDEEITLSCFKEQYTLQLDNEHYVVEPVQVDGQIGEYFNSLDSEFKNILVWNDEKLYYMLSSGLDKNILLKIAENIK